MDNEDIYISVRLDDYLDLMTIREFLAVLIDYGVEEWEEFNDALEDFLSEEEGRDNPLELI